MGQLINNFTTSNKTSNIELNDTWEILHLGFEEIFDKRNMSTPRQLKLYTYVHDFCSSYQTSTRTTCFDQKYAGIAFTGYQLYHLIKMFLINYVTTVAKDGVHLVDEDLLMFYADQWEKYRLSSTILDGICNYLNRYWIYRECEESRRGIYTIYQLALVTWREYMYKLVRKELNDVILKLIETERRGEKIDTRILKITLDSYGELGLNEDEFVNRTMDLKLYKEFEEELLNFVEKIFISECVKLFEENSVCEYIKKAEMMISDEENRVQIYLHETTFPELIKKFEFIFVSTNLDFLLNEFQKFLITKNDVGLIQIFKFTARIPQCLQRLSDVFETHVNLIGLSDVEKHGKILINDPKMYVETILTVKTEFTKMVSKIFDDNARLTEALDKGCAKFINHNFITQLPNSSSAKSAELIAKYFELLLNKKTAQNVDIDTIFTEIMEIFKYIEDKNVFQTFYNKFLAKRLIYQLSINNDAERNVISKLKIICGNEYTLKSERMFNDVNISKDIVEKFPQNFEFDFDVQVLTFGSWPFKPSEINFSLPFELEKCVGEFVTFYNNRHNGRRLTWLHNLSRGELVTSCFMKNYILQVSTFQMVVLLQYNTQDNFSLQQLKNLTQMKIEYLTQVVQILLKIKLLTTEDDESQLQLSTIIRLNTEYKNKNLRVNINTPIKAEIKIEIDSTSRFIEDERKILIQAAIVRIMKTEKSLQHQQLLIEIFKHLSSQFKPTVALIKKCIDLLIGKEYIERCKDQPDNYNYLA